jgi:hypothetical protein
MPIDHYPTAIKLTEKIKENLPMSVSIVPKQAKALRLEHDIDISSTEVLKIENVVYSGDPGGILCSIENHLGEKLLMISITHLKFSQDCPLLAEITDYQERRVMNLMIQDGHIGQAQRRMKERKKRQNSRKGFGS